MKILVRLETKRRLFNSIFLLIIFSLIATIFLDMNQTNKIRGSRPFVGHNTRNISGDSPSLIANESEKRKAAYPKAVYSHNLMMETRNKTGEIAIQNDYIEYARLVSFETLLGYKMLSLSQDPISEIRSKREIKGLWDKVSKGITYEDVDFRPLSSPRSETLPSLLLIANHYNYLYENKIEPVYIDENNNISTTYRYLYNIMPYALILLGILFNYNSVNGDKSSGALKLLLSQSISRSKYYISKWIGGVIQLITVILLPSIIIGLFFGIKNGFVTMKYPITYLAQAFTRIKPIINYYNPSEFPVGPEIHKRAIGHVAVSGPMRDAVLYHKDVEIIPFYKYILIAICLIILFSGFVVALTQLISAIIDNQIISMITNIIIISLGIGLSLPLTFGDRLNLSPLSMFNSLRIIEGTYNVTVLSASITLIFTTIVLLAVGSIYFNRKPI